MIVSVFPVVFVLFIMETCLGALFRNHAVVATPYFQSGYSPYIGVVDAGR